MLTKLLVTPVIPGRLYHVEGTGMNLDIIASHPCDAVCIALAQVLQ